VVAVGRREGVICKPGVGRREHKFRVHPPGPGKVHEEELVEHSRPPFRLALPGNGAQVMQSALASHPAPSVDAAPHLIDVDCIRVEIERLFLALKNGITLDGLHLELHRQIESDLFPGIILELSEPLNRHGGILALPHELPGKIRSPCNIHGKVAGIPLDGFRVIQTDNRLGHFGPPLF